MAAAAVVVVVVPHEGVEGGHQCRQPLDQWISLEEPAAAAVLLESKWNPTSHVLDSSEASHEVTCPVGHSWSSCPYV